MWTLGAPAIFLNLFAAGRDPGRMALEVEKNSFCYWGVDGSALRDLIPDLRWRDWLLAECAAIIMAGAGENPR